MEVWVVHSRFGGLYYVVAVVATLWCATLVCNSRVCASRRLTVRRYVARQEDRTRAHGLWTTVERKNKTFNVVGQLPRASITGGSQCSRGGS